MLPIALPPLAGPIAPALTSPPLPRRRRLAMPTEAPLAPVPTRRAADTIDVDQDILACKLVGTPPSAVLVVGRNQVAKYALPQPPSPASDEPLYRQMFSEPIERASLSPSGAYLLGIREGGQHGAALWQVTEQGLVPDALPQKPLQPVECTITDCGQTLLASTALYQHHLFERPGGRWQQCFALPKQMFVAHHSAFSPDGRLLAVTYSDQNTQIFQKAQGSQRWQHLMHVAVGHDIAWLPAPSHFFVREPAAPNAHPANKHYVAKVVCADNGPSPTCNRMHVGDETLFACGTGEGFARVLRLRNDRNRPTTLLLKLSWFDERVAPRLLDASLPGTQPTSTLRIDWPAPGRWLALYRKGGQRVRLLDVAAD